MTDVLAAGKGMAPISADGPDRRQFLLGAAFFAAAAAGFALEPKRAVGALAKGELERSIPQVIGPWHYASASGLVMPPEDELSERIYDQVLARVYVAEGLPAVMLLIAYGSTQDATLELHRPEFCYPAGGYSILATEHMPVAGMRPGTAEATYLAVARGYRHEQVYYWTRIGRKFPRSSLGQKMGTISANFAGERPDGVLVRTSIVSADKAASLAYIQQFNVSLLRSLGSTGRRILLGGSV